MFSFSDSSSLAWAMRQGLVRCRTKAPLRWAANPPTNEASALLYLCVAAAHGEGGEEVAERIAEHFRSLVAGGNEPSFSSGPFWGHAIVTAAAALARRSGPVWSRLDSDTRERLDCLMECFAVLASYVTDDENDYRTGPLGNGNFHKDWNPNHRMSMVFPMVFAAAYFGGEEAMTARLRAFDFDVSMERFRAYGFTNAAACWGCDPANRGLLMNGGTARFRLDCPATEEKAGDIAGTGTGVRHAYRYLGHGLDDCAGIARELFSFNFDGGLVTSDSSGMRNGLYTAEEVAAQGLDTALVGTPKAYIADHTRSPWEGQTGMMHEFTSFDLGGIRSSGFYCQVDFLLVAETHFAMQWLGLYDVTRDAALWPIVRVGMDDFLYKAEHGYESFSIGKSHGVAREGEELGHLAWKNAWRKISAAQTRKRA